MPSSWIITRPTKGGTKRYRVLYRPGGRETTAKYGGSFKTRTEARTRQRAIDLELAAGRLPVLDLIAAEPPKAPTFADAAERWQASRVDVAEATTIQHRSSLNRALPTLRDRRI